MKLCEIAEKLKLETVYKCDENREIITAYTSDLMSDVLANAKENSILITIQSHKNSIAVASTVDISAVLICNNRPIPDDMIEAAKLENIGIYKTAENQYTTSWKLHQLLNDQTHNCQH